MTAHLKAVIKGIFFIGFSIQIILGVIWMCCNFTHIQDFPATDATLYRGIFRMVGECPQVMYILQLAAAFAVGYFFLQSLIPVGRVGAVWRALVLLTFPFALQSHMAVQPHSFVGTLFLCMLMFGVNAVRGKNACKHDSGTEIEGCGGEAEGCGGKTEKVGKKPFVATGLALLCAIGLILMSGVLDWENREVFASRGIEGNLASRFGWYTLMNDVDYWSEDLREIAADAWWSARYCPENMELLFAAIEEGAAEEEVRGYLHQIARVGWQYRKPVIIRLIGWDVLGYTVTPLIVPLQLAGDAYDSFTGRNYEIMGGAAPRLTGYYVNYSCWWFGVELVLSLVLSLIWLGENIVAKSARKKGAFQRIVPGVGLCLVASGVLVAVLTMRGAGLMDYKWTIAVNELWLVWALLLMGRMRMHGDEMVE